MPLSELISGLAVALIIWYGGGQVVADRISLGTLVAFISYMQMFFRPVRDLAEKYNILQGALASGERIFHLLDNDQALAMPAKPQRFEQQTAGEVCFENVTFGYQADQPVLKDISFTIPPGRSWAVVGATGAGKTSLVNLLMRFYDPQAGRILIDGRDLTRLDPAELARRVALVDQDVFLLAGSASQNIRLGREWISDQDLRRALAVSGAEQFVGPAGAGAGHRAGRRREAAQLGAAPTPGPGPGPGRAAGGSGAGRGHQLGGPRVRAHHPRGPTPGHGRPHLAGGGPSALHHSPRGTVYW